MAYVKQARRDKLMAHTEYIVTYGQDMPEILNWRWPSA
jgi:xylulose-5-phosphate/fructose-6-phosphate phosphoketolase